MRAALAPSLSWALLWVCSSWLAGCFADTAPLEGRRCEGADLRCPQGYRCFEGYCANEEVLGPPDASEDPQEQDDPTDDQGAEVGGDGCDNQDGDGYASEGSPDTCLLPREPVECDSNLRPDNASRNPSAAELCDGQDNDCDGLTDGDDPSLVAPACERQAGVCAGSKQRCVAGRFEPCGPQEYAAAASASGAVYLPLESFCASAQRDSAGRCALGLNPNLDGLPDPAAALCDGRDNDCDGEVDDPSDTLQPCYQGASGAGLPGQPTLDAPTGACHAGSLRCQGGTYGAVCEGEQGPSAEDTAELRCDDLDQNCDGVVREGCECVPGQERPCYEGPPGSRGFGECRDGTQRCQPSGTYGACEGQTLPTPETCDNLGQDDDCDGEADNIEGYEYGASCGDARGGSAYPEVLTGLPGVCAAGELRCDASCGDRAFCCVPGLRPGERPETCDDRNVDDDCDGDLDDLDRSAEEPADDIAVGGACQTGQDGICEEGRWACPNGPGQEPYPTCNPLYSPLASDLGNNNPMLDDDRQVATCNGRDDDCDGDVDEDADFTLSPNCGRCGVACGNNQDCCPPAVGAAPSQYACATYRANNDNVQGDPNNCGGCGFDQAEGDPHRCAPGEACCGEVCADLQTDEDHCGQCGRSCGANQNCCGGQCINKSNRDHCGACDNDCDAQANTVCCLPLSGVPVYECRQQPLCD